MESNTSFKRIKFNLTIEKKKTKGQLVFQNYKTL